MFEACRVTVVACTPRVSGPVPKHLLDPAVTLRVIESFASAPVTDNAAARRLASLTERETEVLRLVAEGLSNAEIAARLYLGEATVKTYLSRMLTKLDLRDRVQAVAFAYESGLVTPGSAPGQTTRQPPPNG